MNWIKRFLDWSLANEKSPYQDFWDALEKDDNTKAKKKIIEYSEREVIELANKYLVIP
ncbi:hypothetical protein POTTS_115 [Klebsiella phage vB_KpnM_Potts1]|uniref:Uncharacterized protein n=1 Tax=Klebsiella phage vB_KpnM_Potts1 TaxID=2591366 RepID=A0A5B9NIR9_9CAUD|nr:hypothetical protein POTTS_115 [Klebsiella phage vB_KpnM_Potts1]